MEDTASRPLLASVESLMLGGSAVAAQTGTSFTEDLGNFPDAIQVTAVFGSFVNLQINGDSITGTGFHFRVGNTSWGNGASSAFAADPDGHFAEDDVLTSAAAAALEDRQAFGLFKFGAELPLGSGDITSAPTGFGLEIESAGLGAVEVNFEIDLSLGAEKLLFDSNAPAAKIDSTVFTNLRTGVLDFFVSTPSTGLAANLLAVEDDLPAVSVGTSLAWAEAGAVVTEFSASGKEFDERRLRPRGELIVPEPSALALLGAGLAVAALRPGRKGSARAATSSRLNPRSTHAP